MDALLEAIDRAAAGSAKAPSAKKPKKSTESGEARKKIIAALTKWHKYRVRSL
jgi:hypothetical protein